MKYYLCALIASSLYINMTVNDLPLKVCYGKPYSQRESFLSSSMG